jgi:hypothetical protein
VLLFVTHPPYESGCIFRRPDPRLDAVRVGDRVAVVGRTTLLQTGDGAHRMDDCRLAPVGPPDPNGPPELPLGLHR